MVISEEVQGAVYQEQLEFSLEWLAMCQGVRPSDLGAHDDVAEEQGPVLFLLVEEGKGENIGDLVLSREPSIETPHVIGRDEQDRKLRGRIHVEAVERVPGERGQMSFGNRDLLLVGNENLH
jgi:hypothetical protein